MKKNVIGLDDIRVKKARKLVGAGILTLSLSGAMMLTGCSDSKSCTDSDVNRFDTGTFADPTDFGGQADPVGAGDRCSDFD